MEQWIRSRVDVYLRHGGKTHRRRQVSRLVAALEDIRQHEPGVKLPPQIGRAHIHRYYSRHGHLSARTLDDHYRAFVLLWELLERPGKPPKHSSETG